MMTRQTTWSVLGSNLQQLGITENQQDDDDQNDDIDSDCVGKNTANGMDYRADALGQGGCFLADIHLCPFSNATRADVTKPCVVWMMRWTRVPPQVTFTFSMRKHIQQPPQ